MRGSLSGRRKSVTARASPGRTPQSPGRQLFALQTLRQPFTRLPADRVQVAYAQGYLAVRALVDRYGADRLRQLLTTLGTGSSLETAFETVFTTRLATFEADLLRQLTG